MNDTTHTRAPVAQPAEVLATDQSRADAVIRQATTAAVVLLAGIAAVVSYRHMHTLAVRHGEAAWTAALVPLSVDGMIIAASMSLLFDSRRGRRGGILPWTLLIVGSTASLAANVAVAESSLVGRLVAAWPSFALIGAYELLMRQIRNSAGSAHMPQAAVVDDTPASDESLPPAAAAHVVDAPPERRPGRRQQAKLLRRQAWEWALASSHADGSFPSGEVIGRRFARGALWGRLVKNAGLRGEFDTLPQES